MEVEKTFRALRLLRSTAPLTTLRLFGLLNLRAFYHQIDGMLACETFQSRNWHRVCKRLTFGESIRNFEHTDLLAFPRIIKLNVNLKGTLTTRCQVKIKLGIVSLLDTCESLHALGILSQATETEILKTNDSTVLNASQIHGVFPYVMIVLHPVVAVRTIHEAGIACTIIFIRWQTENLEALAGYLCTSIGIAIRSCSHPLVVLCIGIIAGNGHLTTFSHRFLVPCNLYWSDHCLTGIAETTGRTMIEDVPLTIDLLQRTMGVVSSIGGYQLRAVLVQDNTTRVDKHTTCTPGTER